MSVDLDELERVARAATPGPWQQGARERGRVFCASGATTGIERVLARVNERMIGFEQDAAFIAAASPDVVIALIERVRELEAQFVMERAQMAHVGEGWTP